MQATVNCLCHDVNRQTSLQGYCKNIYIHTTAPSTYVLQRHLLLDEIILTLLHECIAKFFVAFPIEHSTSIA